MAGASTRTKVTLSGRLASQARETLAPLRERHVENELQLRELTAKRDADSTPGGDQARDAEIRRRERLRDSLLRRQSLVCLDFLKKAGFPGEVDRLYMSRDVGGFLCIDLQKAEVLVQNVTGDLFQGELDAQPPSGTSSAHLAALSREGSPVRAAA